MKLIDADDILPMMERKMDMQDLYLPIHFQEMVIDEMPTLDAVQVVRCEDCKHKCGEHDGYICCDKNVWRDPKWFCADVERKEE